MNSSTALDPVASVQPRILVLDDEFAQRAGICLQLGSVGYYDFLEFEDPRPALEFLRHNEVDLVIVDIRMPNLPVDGLWFMEQFRAFDSVTSIIIRTAHDDLAIADAALEARAIRRVLKSHPKASESLRRSVSLGIVETRQRRRTQRDAAATVSTQDQLVDVLARTDDQIAVAEMCRGFTASLSGQIEVLGQHAAALARADITADEFHPLAAQHLAAVERLGAEVTAFLGNSYLARLGNTPGIADVDQCLDALSTALVHNAALTNRALVFSLRRPSSRLSFCANPQRVVTALRHLAEYCAMQARLSSAFAISATLEPKLRADLETARTGHYVLNAKAATREPCVALTVHVDLAGFNLALLHEALRRCSENPRVANLLMLSAAIADNHLVFEVSLNSPEPSTFTLYLPAARSG